MLKTCGKSVCIPLELIFSECISNGLFPSEWNVAERSAFSQEKQQTMFGKLPPCFVTTNLWQNP